jgi:hypothetical protein
MEFIVAINMTWGREQIDPFQDKMIFLNFMVKLKACCLMPFFETINILASKPPH